MKKSFLSLFTKLMRKGARHWLTVALIILGSYLLGPYIDNYLRLDQVKYWLFQSLSQLTTQPLKPQYVRLLLIDDKDYWLGAPAGRAPIKRGYLAAILDKLDATGVSVIGIDFDMRSPDPASTFLSPDYQEETDTLVSTIVRVAEKHKIVLAKSIWVDAHNQYILDHDIYQTYGLCLKVDSRGHWTNSGTPGFPLSPVVASNISCGYVSLPFDMRLVVGRIVLADGQSLDSFSMAIARAAQPKLVDAMDADSRFGSYITQEAWEKSESIFTVRKIMSQTESTVTREFGTSVVVLGGSWNSFAFGRGGQADLHNTPVGALLGAIVHANFVEATLGKRTFHATANWLPRVCEVVFSLLAAMAFSIREGALAKVAGLLGFSIMMLLFQWILLQAFGVFFEAIVPVLGLWLHSVVEQLIDRSGE